MSKVMYKSDASYVSCRAGVYYYTRRVPYDVRQHYASHRLSFSLRTKSNAGALRAAQTVTQRLEDYWLGLPSSGYGHSSHPLDKSALTCHLSSLDQWCHEHAVNPSVQFL